MTHDPGGRLRDAVRRPSSDAESNRTVLLTRILIPVLAVAVALLTGCGADSASAPRVIVLGFDGMDHALTRQLLEEGRLPNLARLAEEGSFRPLETSVPPQSPVAWSNFITGMDAGGHGIFDFVHRDPATMAPYLSTSETTEVERTITLGRWQVPLSGGEVRLLRHGEEFWSRLEEAGVATTIIRMPANFPPSGTATRELSGMGTPDLIGTSGTFTFFTSDMTPWRGEEIGGGQVFPVDVIDHVVDASLFGPENPFLVEEEDLFAEFSVYVDPVDPVAKIALGDREIVLQEGEWSDWVTYDFVMIPYLQSLRGMVRLYLKQVRPTFQLYASPINIDPRQPAMPISTPEGYAGELAQDTGRFYTQEMPEDTAAVRADVLDRDEFLEQAAIVRREGLEQFERVISGYENGFLFYYLGTADQISHIMWKTLDPTHPAYDPEIDAAYADVIPSVYEELDRVVGMTLDRIDELDEDVLLVVMSDHGFASFKRAFNPNTWLVENGFMVLDDPSRRNPDVPFLGVDWSRTRAYAMGLSGLYVNLRGRERYGIVPPSRRDEVIRELREKLLAEIDPATGEPAVSRLYVREEVYDDSGHLETGPDLQVGYSKGTRASSDAGLGGIAEEVYSDNLDEWSGDHIMDHTAVPGILLTNRALQQPSTSLENLAAALLAEYGIERFPDRSEEPGSAPDQE